MGWFEGAVFMRNAPNPFLAPFKPITASNEEIRAALEQAEVPPLLPALAYLTGDLSLLRRDLRPPVFPLPLPQGGLTPDQQANIRKIALDTIIHFRDTGSQPAPPPSDENLLRIMEFAVGGANMKPYLPLLEEELAYRGEDRRAPDWNKKEIAPNLAFEVIIIGAGMSGLLAAHRLQQAAVPFLIVDKSSDVGGTWLENSYPGCRVDNPSHNYSYSFAQKHDWPFHFSDQKVLLDYFRRCAEIFGLRQHIRFRTEVLSLSWSDEDQLWLVRVRTPEGAEEILQANAVISAVGQLNRPLYPNIKGRDSFEGAAFHSACWNHEIDLKNKRVAIIGTAASASQIIPEIAPIAGNLLIFQRTPPWMAHTPDYHAEVAPGLQWLYAAIPSYSEWHRFWILWQMGDGMLEAVRISDSWGLKNQSVSPLNDMIRKGLTEYLNKQFVGRPDLIRNAIPTYPPFSKRLLRDDGEWAKALTRENVELITEPVKEITKKSLITSDGKEHPVDVIIYATGFQASKFLSPMTVTGRNGLDLHKQWNNDARAYLGISVPGFPNLFCLYGPNTNLVVNGSIIFFSECGVRYILGCIKLLLKNQHSALDIKTEKYDAFNVRVDAENRKMAWSIGDVHNWYKNESGRVSQNWPFTVLEYWQKTIKPDEEDYVFFDK